MVFLVLRFRFLRCACCCCCCFVWCFLCNAFVPLSWKPKAKAITAWERQSRRPSSVIHSNWKQKLEHGTRTRHLRLALSCVFCFFLLSSRSIFYKTGTRASLESRLCSIALCTDMTAGIQSGKNELQLLLLLFLSLLLLLLSSLFRCFVIFVILDLSARSRPVARKICARPSARRSYVVRQLKMEHRIP